MPSSDILLDDQPPQTNMNRARLPSLQAAKEMKLAFCSPSPGRHHHSPQRTGPRLGVRHDGLLSGVLKGEGVLGQVGEEASSEEKVTAGPQPNAGPLAHCLASSWLGNNSWCCQEVTLETPFPLCLLQTHKEPGGMFFSLTNESLGPRTGGIKELLFSDTPGDRR